jgi:hypothetical protein
MSEAVTRHPKALMHSIIQRVATGPESSKAIFLLSEIRRQGKFRYLRLTHP